MADGDTSRGNGVGRGGFTLIEVLVSLAILAATLLLAYRIIAGAIAAEGRSEHWTVCSYLAEALVREATATFPDTGESEGKFAPPMDAYSWKRTVRAAAHSDAREVDVTVTWGSDSGAEQVTLYGIAVK